MSNPNMTPVKVTMECTPSGWKLVVYAENRIVYRGESRMEGMGSARGIGFDDMHIVLADHPKFLDAMEDLGFGPFGLCQALMRIENGDDEVEPVDSDFMEEAA